MSRKVVLVVFLSIFSSLFLFPQKAVSSKLSSSESANLKQGADAYKNEDWTSAMFFLRKVVSAPAGVTDETMFMLIKSEIYAGEYRQAQNDCVKFMEQFTVSPYSEYVRYQNGRLLHLLARNEDAVLSLAEFCHQNPESDLYPLALFWIAESFYDEYNFDSARGLYERVVSDYPACEKAPQAQYKLDLIERRAREEKLLYLLKVIGEENLSTREEYERQLRVYALEDERGVKKSLIDAQARIAELEALLQSGGYAEEEPVVEVAEKAPVVEPAPVPVEEKPAVTSSVTVPIKPKQTTVNIIQNVSESSLKVKQNASGHGTSAVKNSGDSAKEAEVQALKRKAKQLQYLLEGQEQTEEDAK